MFFTKQASFFCAYNATISREVVKVTTIHIHIQLARKYALPGRNVVYITYGVTVPNATYFKKVIDITCGYCMSHNRKKIWLKCLLKSFILK